MPTTPTAIASTRPFDTVRVRRANSPADAKPTKSAARRAKRATRNRFISTDYPAPHRETYANACAAECDLRVLGARSPDTRACDRSVFPNAGAGDSLWHEPRHDASMIV